jgi:hypothetical protein
MYGVVLEMEMGASFRPAENGEVVASCSSFYSVPILCQM